jgi:hypothetical protein
MIFLVAMCYGEPIGDSSRQRFLGMAHGRRTTIQFVNKAETLSASEIDDITDWLKTEEDAFTASLAANLLAKLVDTVEMDRGTVDRVRVALEEKSHAIANDLTEESRKELGESIKRIQRRSQELEKPSGNPLALPLLSKSGSTEERELRILLKTMPFGFPPQPSPEWLARFDKLDEKAILILERWLAADQQQNGHAILHAMSIALQRSRLSASTRERFLNTALRLYKNPTSVHDPTGGAAWDLLRFNADAAVAKQVLPLAETANFSACTEIMSLVSEKIDPKEIPAALEVMERAKARFLKQGFPPQVPSLDALEKRMLERKSQAAR